MSYDLSFWKEDSSAAAAPGEIYELFRISVNVPGVALLPVEQILDRLIEIFEDFEPHAQFPMIHNEHGSAEVFHGPQRFSFSFRGDWNDLVQSIADVMNAFDCVMYDPQSDRKYQPGQYWVDDVASDAEPRERLDESEEVRLSEADERWLNMTKEERLEVHRQTDPEFYALLMKQEADKAQRAREAEEERQQCQLIADAIIRHAADGRWKRCGHDPMYIARILLTDRLCGEVPPPDPLTRPGAADYHRDAVHGRLTFAILGFLEALPPDHRYADWRQAMRATGTLGVNYFYGDWREGYREWDDSEPMTRDQTRRTIGWIDPYRESLLAALTVDDEASLKQILAWPGEDLPVDDGTLDMTAMDNAYHTWLAMRLRGEDSDALEHVAGRIRNGKRPRAILLMQTAEALLNRDEAAFEKHLRKVVTNFAKSGFRTNRMDASICIEGTILWHIARRNKLRLPNLDDDVMDLIVH